MSQPLNGLRVIDLTHARAGPTCVRQLADWGADVVKVENPVDRGDIIGDQRLGFDFQNLHRNKRSISVHLKTDEGRELVYDLARTADVVVENFRPDVKKRLRVDYETLSRINPRLVYASISGYGQDGPYVDRTGVDQIAQGMSGLMSVTGFAGGGPVRVGTAIGDMSAGLLLANGVLIALLERERTGKGRWVQTSLVEALIFMMDFQAARWLIAREVPQQVGNTHPYVGATGTFKTKDGYVNIAAENDTKFAAMCGVLGIEPLIMDPRFSSFDVRGANKAALNDEIERASQVFTTGELVESLNAVSVSCGPIYTINEVFEDPQIRHMGIAQQVESKHLGCIEVVGQAVRFSDFVALPRCASPDKGEHTRSVLTEIGYTEDRINILYNKGVIF